MNKFWIIIFCMISINYSYSMDVNLLNSLYHQPSHIDSSSDEKKGRGKPLCSHPSDIKKCKPFKTKHEEFSRLYNAIEICKGIPLVKNSMCEPYVKESKYDQIKNWGDDYPKIKGSFPKHCECYKT